MASAPDREVVLILDFGAQYCQLIARRVREQQVFCQIVRHDLSAKRIAADCPITRLIEEQGICARQSPIVCRRALCLVGIGDPVIGDGEIACRSRQNRRSRSIPDQIVLNVDLLEDGRLKQVANVVGRNHGDRSVIL